LGDSLCAWQKILDTAKRIGYRPNALVRGVTGGRSRIVALILSDLTQDYAVTQIAPTSDYLREHGYALLTLNSGRDREQERSCFHLAVDHRVSGILLHGVALDSSTEHFKELIDSNIPFLITKEHSSAIKVPHVYRDDREAIRQAVAEAIALGHRHFGHIAGSQESLEDSMRFKWYKDALSAFDTPISDKAIVAADWTAEAAEHSTLQLFAQCPQTTYIFAANDEMAIGVYRAAMATNRCIPDDLSVLGSGDMNVSKLLTPSLNTLAQKSQELAETSCKLLLRMVELGNFDYNQCQAQSFTVPGMYIPRQSVSRVPDERQTTLSLPTRLYDE
jgi:DNA-binding LacI/PurR family transcriptional regulator